MAEYVSYWEKTRAENFIHNTKCLESEFKEWYKDAHPKSYDSTAEAHAKRKVKRIIRKKETLIKKYNEQQAMKLSPSY